MSTMTRRRTKKRVGLNSHGRIDWQSINNLSCLQLAQHGFHAATIAKATGLTINQVYYRYREVGIQLRDYRNGKTAVSRVVMQKYSVKTIDDKHARELRRNVVTPDNLD